LNGFMQSVLLQRLNLLKVHRGRSLHLRNADLTEKFALSHSFTKRKRLFGGTGTSNSIINPCIYPPPST